MNRTKNSSRSNSFKKLALVLAFAMPAFAMSSAYAAGVELKIDALHQVETTVNGVQSKKLEPLARALPGDEVTYVLNYHNTGDKPADNVVLNNPIPEHMTYVTDSATGDNAQVSVSVDGGINFGALEKLRVKTGNGTRPATAADVTNVRWKFTTSIKPGASGSVSYRAVLQ